MEEMWRNTSLSPSPPLHNTTTNTTTSCWRGLLSTALSLNSSRSQLLNSNHNNNNNNHQESYTSGENSHENSELNIGECNSNDNTTASLFSGSDLNYTISGCGSARDAGRSELEQEVYEGFGAWNGGADRRKMRMIKNRESAARSRARKQAYANELEKEVAHLQRENKKLKQQHEELTAAMAAQVPVKRVLQRTLSAPI